MKRIPILIIIISVLFVITGIGGLWSHLKDFSNSDISTFELILGTVLRLLAIICGFLLFVGNQWGRWLAIFWICCHIVISAFNSTTELLAHLFFLIVASVLLFQPKATAFFKKNRKKTSR